MSQVLGSSTSNTPPSIRSLEPGASLFVWSVWAVLLLAGLGFVFQFGPEVPVEDDYALVPALTGDQAMTLEWLWSLHNEHRVPVPRLLLLAAYWMTGNDFRAGMFVSVLTISLLAAVLIGLNRWVRGFAIYADALFPMLLLHWGHHSNFLWSWQVSFTVAVFVLGLITVGIVLQGSRIRTQAIALMGLELAILVGFGAHGLAFVPALLIWLFVLTIVQKKSDRWVACMAMLPASLLLGLYFWGYERPDEFADPPDLGAVWQTFLQFFATGFGPIAGEAWFFCGWLMIALATSSFFLLLRAAWFQPDDRASALGLAALLSGFVPLGLGLAWGRASLGQSAGLEPRYVTLMALLPCFVVLVWTRYAKSSSARFLSMMIFVSSCVLLWPNTQIGLQAARGQKERSDAVLADIRSGLPPYRIIARNTPWLSTSHDKLTPNFQALQREKIGPFARMRSDPPMVEIPLALNPSFLSLARWDGSTKTIDATGVDPWVQFRLAEPSEVAGLRIVYSHDNGSRTSPWFKLLWRRPDQAAFPKDQIYQRWTMPTGPDQSITAWIDSPVAEFRMQPDNRPCRFQIQEVVLLIPMEGQ